MLLTPDDHAVLLAVHAKSAGSTAIVPLANLMPDRKMQQQVAPIARKLANMAFAVANIPYAKTDNLVYLTSDSIALSDAGLNYLHVSGLVPRSAPAAGRKPRAPKPVPGL